MSQPLTVGVWDRSEAFDGLNALQLEQSDLISFHAYSGPEETEAIVDLLAARGRPVVCTEWMARPLDSRIATHLPMFAERRVGCYLWGLVNGRTQTHIPWASLREQLGTAEWFHDLFHGDGRPYREEEIALLRRLSPRAPR
jgi:hypothetical protein